METAVFTWLDFGRQVSTDTVARSVYRRTTSSVGVDSGDGRATDAASDDADAAADEVADGGAEVKDEAGTSSEEDSGSTAVARRPPATRAKSAGAPAERS